METFVMYFLFCDFILKLFCMYPKPEQLYPDVFIFDKID